MFHPKCGEHVRLSNENRTATRIASEFNHGLVFSSEPLLDEELFEIRIDKKTESWIGSLEIGVTTCDPNVLNIPASAIELNSGTWILSGKSVLQDGCTLLEMYPLNLDKITEGETVGVLRSKTGDLEFFYNGVSHGPAATNIPSNVYAVVVVYGNVSQITILQKNRVNGGIDFGDLEIQEVTMSQSTEASAILTQERPTERLRFHERTGSLVKLSCNGRAAERIRPLDEFNNAVVMSKKPLVADTLFEIRIDVLVDKWSGSIEVGVTTHDPAVIEFPTTMTNMGSGTIMMSGCGILTNGKGTKREYGEFNLDELRVGDRIGMLRKSNGDLHYFINGLDQGIAARVPSKVWGVVDLYGMTVKVTIVDRDEREEQNLITRRNTVLRETVTTSLNDVPDEDSDDRLMFHSNCGSHAAVINNGRTAHRPNALDEFNNAVVLTNRPLKINEVFEVRIDKMVTKWAGSIEIGVTTHAPTKLEYPSTMTNVRSGTWIMTGNGVMHNGTSVIDDYGQNLDKLQAGDRVGVVIREGGALHFLVNGEDQGEAGTGLPGNLYAVIDLYGQATQATIVSHCPSCSPTTPTPTANSPFFPEIHFHSVHGRNARITNGGKTASRPRALVEFNDAIVITNRPLRPGEMFSVVVERIVDRWSGSIEAGVTAIKPDELELPGTMTDIDHDTWMLSGFAVMKDGIPLKHGYPLNLDKIKTGSIIGLKRHDDSSLHYYLDGVDQGEACTGLPSLVYPVIDLYGQCAQVSIVSNVEPTLEIDDLSVQQVESHVQSESTVLPTSQPLHKWHETCGKGIRLTENLISRPPEIPCSGIALSAAMLSPGELWEVSIEAFLPQWASSLYFGVTQFSPSEPLPHSIRSIKQPTWYIHGSEFYYCGDAVKTHYCSSLDWLRPGNRIGVKRCVDSSLHFYIDGHDQGIAATNVPKKIFGVAELYGSTSSLKLISKGFIPLNGDAPLAEIESSQCDKHTDEDYETVKRAEDMDKSIEDGELLSEIHDLEIAPLLFHDCHGRNVQISESRLAAKRVSSYNQGLVLCMRTVPRGTLFQIKIESLNPRWVSSLSIGMTTESVVGYTLPVTALGLKKDTWVISSDTVFHNGHKVKSRYGANLDSLSAGKTLGIMVDEENQLRLFINGIDQGVAATNIPAATCLPLVDLYGMCDQVCIIGESGSWPESPIEDHVWAETREKGNLEVREKPGALRSKSDKMNENIQCSSHTSPSANAANTLLLEKRSLNESFKSPTVAVRSLGSSLAVTPISPVSFKQPTCEYLSACLRLKTSLGLPSGYFRKEVMCFCCGCCSTLRLGKPDIPQGWTILPLRRRGETQLTDTWHVAYFTSHVGNIRRILDLGEVILPDEYNYLGDIQRRVDRKMDDSISTKLTLSPSLSSPSVFHKHPYVDPKTKEQLLAYAAIEVLIRPGSYKIASETEWVTKERNSTSLSAVLLRLDSPS